MTEPTPKKSDLGVRTASAIVMVAMAGTALWLGGWVWTLFVAAVALGVLWEWWGLVVGFTTTVISRCIWSACGLAYVGLAAFILVIMRALITNSVLVQLHPQIFSILPYPKLYEIWPLLVVIVAVIAVDIGAYFAGRAIGGAKIAPSISPSKTI